MARSLRLWLSLGLSVLVALAVLTVLAMVLGTLVPHLNAEVDAKNQSLGRAAAVQTERFIGGFSAELRRLAKDMASMPEPDAARRRAMLDTLANADDALEALYVTDDADRVAEVGLPVEKRDLRASLLGSDFSRRAFVRKARESGEAAWSDTYLSVRGQIVVAVAIPLNGGTVVGELDLANVSAFAREIGTAGGVLTIILDQYGHVIGHPDAERALRQENLGQLPLLQDRPADGRRTDRFRLDGIAYVGSTTPISGRGWTVLVAQPVDLAYATVRSTLLALAGGGAFSLLLALVTAYFVSRRITRRVTAFGEHMEAIAGGNYGALIPRSGTDEIEKLSHSMRRMAAAVLDREARLRLAATVFSGSAEGICITDAKKRILSVNPALIAITGYTAEEVVGRTPAVFQSGRHDREFYRAMWQRIEREGFWRGEIWNRRKNGEIFPEWLTVTEVRDDAGEITHYIGSFFDLTERKQQEEHIRFLAHHDALTKLPNRTLLDDRVRQAIAKSRRNGDHVAVLFVDLDRFKLINDTLGHDVGDRLLECVAASLKGVLRETETVARLGGDEFVILIPELEDAERVAPVARKVLSVVAAPIHVGEQTLHVTPSIGISIFPEDGDDPQTLLRNADTAMYHAKERGRNNFQFYTPAMNAAVQERVSVENDLRLALERGEFELHFQPQVDSSSLDVIGMEALIRWHHPTRGMIPPNHFIPIAEETGLIVQIGEWVLLEACRQARCWHEAGHARLRMGVNLSARQFLDARLPAHIDAAIDASGMDPGLLELEITESMLMADPDNAIELLRRLTARGVRVAIDDFGTGYSSLAYLKHFPVTRLKIDRSFVRDLAVDPSDAAIVRAVVAMAESLHLEVIAEGVETREQLDFLNRHGCYAIQGYYFGRPRPAAAFDSDSLSRACTSH